MHFQTVFVRMGNIGLLDPGNLHGLSNALRVDRNIAQRPTERGGGGHAEFRHRNPVGRTEQDHPGDLFGAGGDDLIGVASDRSGIDQAGMGRDQGFGGEVIVAGPGQTGIHHIGQRAGFCRI